MRQYRLIKNGIPTLGMGDSRWFISEDRSRLIIDLGKTATLMNGAPSHNAGIIGDLAMAASDEIKVIDATHVVFSIKNGRMRIFTKRPNGKIDYLKIDFSTTLNLLGVRFLHSEYDVNFTYSSDTVSIPALPSDQIAAVNTNFEGVTYQDGIVKIKNKMMSSMRDKYSSFFLRLIRRFGKLNKIDTPKLEYMKHSEFTSYNYKDEEIFATLLLLSSPILRAIHTPNLRYGHLIDSIPNCYNEGIPALGELNTYVVNGHRLHWKQILTKFILSRDLHTFTKFVAGRPYPKLISLIGEWFKNSAYPITQHVIPNNTVIQAGIPNIIDAIVSDYYIHDITTSATTATNSTTIYTQVYQGPQIQFLEMLVNVLMVTSNCDLWYQVLKRFMESNSKGTKFKGRHTEVLLNNKAIDLLNVIGEKKAVKLLKEVGSWDTLRDAGNMYADYRSTETLPDKVKMAFPNGIILPAKIRDTHQLHDEIANQHRAIKRMTLEIEKSAPFIYKHFESFVKFLDGKKIDDNKILIPKSGIDLLMWGEELKNCIGSYDTTARAEDSLLLAVEDVEGRIQNTVEISKDFTIKQCVRKFNEQDKEMSGKLSNLLAEFIKEQKEFLFKPADKETLEEVLGEEILDRLDNEAAV